MHIVDALNPHFMDYGSNKYRPRRTLLLEINQFLCGFDIEYVIGKRTVWIKDKADHSLILIYSEKKKKLKFCLLVEVLGSLKFYLCNRDLNIMI